MRQSIEISVELTAQELLDKPDPAGLVEIDNVYPWMPVTTHGDSINTVPTSASPAAISEDEFEIELTPEEIDALLEGRL